MKWLLLVLAFVLGAAITWFLTVKHASRTMPDGAGSTVEPAAPEPTPVVSPGEPVAGAVGIGGGADLAAAAGAGVMATEPTEPTETPQTPQTPQSSQDEVEGVEGGFGGAHTPLSEPPGPAESWNRNAEDEDALLSRSSVESADVVAPVADATPDGGAASELAPVVDGTPNGDLAGVGESEAVAALEEAAEEDDAGSWADEVPDVEPSQDDLDVDVSVTPAITIVPVADATPSGDVAGVPGPGVRPTQGELTFDEPDDSVPPEEKPLPVRARHRALCALNGAPATLAAHTTRSLTARGAVSG